MGFPFFLFYKFSYKKPLFCVVLDKADNWNSIFIVVGVVCALLVALMIAALYLLRIRQKKGGCIS